MNHSTTATFRHTKGLLGWACGFGIFISIHDKAATAHVHLPVWFIGVLVVLGITLWKLSQSLDTMIVDVADMLTKRYGWHTRRTLGFIVTAGACSFVAQPLVDWNLASVLSGTLLALAGWLYATARLFGEGSLKEVWYRVFPKQSRSRRTTVPTSQLVQLVLPQVGTTIDRYTTLGGVLFGPPSASLSRVPTWTKHHASEEQFLGNQDCSSRR